MFAISGKTLPIFPKKQLREATQGNGTDQNCQTDQIPAVPPSGTTPRPYSKVTSAIIRKKGPVL